MNEEIVKSLVECLNDNLAKYNMGYNEDLHNLIINKFNDIAEEAYRKWLGKW